MPKASSALLLVGLLVLWAELLPASVLNVTIKAGVCPEPAVEEANCTMGCQSDGDCESTLKCCPAACGKACQEPNAKSGLCPLKRARRDAACPNLCTDDRDCPGDKKCCFSGCGLACTAPYTAKSGACPVVLRGSLGPCLERCDSDADCPGTKKCCTTGCGHVCKLPIEGELQKPGLCPRDFTQCLHQDPPLCTNDSACPGWLKCCSHECRLRCTPPAEEKPGACSAAAPEGLFYPCSFRCQEDKDCLGSQKCCPLGCGPACVEPAQDICHLPAAPGPCGGHEMSFFYNVTSGHCEKFRYSGCGGNANRFGTRAACRRACLSHGKDGFCPASSGLFPSYDCREWCRHDADCPGEEKCCLQGCDYVCLHPAQDKPGRCPKVRLQLTSEPCMEEDDCLHDRDCPRQEKCCFSSCAMRCSRPAREHDAAVVPQHDAGWCPEQCDTDSQCPQGQRCTRSSCGRVCMDMPRGPVQVTSAA
ncbi:UNVERIFIED_CONTAM: hypothetical protein H355_013227 [Colinus virginianus]|nr:hypothetical protein H355_013227 [Colinus virginianus]